jgi:hypothetical protein
MDDTTCCPQFDPAPWNEKLHDWKDKKFIRDHVITFLHMPVNFGSVVKRMMARIEDAGAQSPGWMGLSDHTSKWNMDLYVAVDREVPGADNTTLSGQFFSKVYEGPFKDTGKWCKDFESLVRSRNLDVKKWFMWYTTCPKCARKYGRNYVVILGKTGDAG